MKDHFGTIRTTVKGWESTVTEDFISGSLSQGTVVSGGGFTVQNGELQVQNAGENQLVNNNGKVFGDVIITVDVKKTTAPGTDVSIIVR